MGNIVTFPAGRAEQVGRARIAAALARLEVALTEQAAAAAEWRRALGTLNTAVSGLDRSMSDLDSRLGRLRADNEALGAQARQLESWADSALSRARLP